MKKEAVRKQAEHEAVVVEHEKKYNELLATLQQERQEHEAKQHSLSASASSEEQLADSVRQLQDELAALKKSHDEASGVASDLQSALDDACGKLAESQALVKAKDAAVSSLQARLSEVRYLFRVRLCLTLSQNERSLDAEVAQNGKLDAELQSKVAELQSLQSRNRDEVSALNSKLESLQMSNAK
jgi:chromosome segregation ATPase